MTRTLGLVLSCLVLLFTIEGANATTATQCTVLKICYCANAEFLTAISGRVAEIRKAIRSQRAQGKTIGYISVPISSVGGSYFGVNVDVAEDVRFRVEARLGRDYVWLLNPGDKAWTLPTGASGADYMLMWTQVLEGEDGLAPDFDFVYFVGPSDFAASLGLNGAADLQKLDAYYDRRAKSDAELQKIDRKAFRNYYGLNASVSFSLGSHDEWNIAKAINEARRNKVQPSGAANQLAILFDGRGVVPPAFEVGVQPGDAAACAAK